MNLLDSIKIDCAGKSRVIQLLEGNLAWIPNEHEIDLLIVSAFPDDYSPIPCTLIEALHKRGISVEALSSDKAVDLRNFSCCWLSKSLDDASLNFRQLLCFEPAYKGSAPEMVGDIFRSLVPFCDGQSIKSVAMPVLASGNQMEDSDTMLKVLIDACIHWLNEGRLPLDVVKIVLLEGRDCSSAISEFSKAKKKLELAAKRTPGNDPYTYDLFVSYSHKNMTEANQLVNEIKNKKPDIRIFIDKAELTTGLAWQQSLFESLENSRTVICLYSPEYLNSKVCKDEFHVAWLRHREDESGVLFPILLYSSELPKHMQLIQFEDVREGNLDRLQISANNYLKKHFPP